MPIPKTLHLIWIGDESKQPNAMIESWCKMNPSYTVRLWGNQDLVTMPWKAMPQIKAWFPREINGAADVMRWEVLYRFGGVAVDADSWCVRPLEDWLLEPDCFAVWENEIVRPGLIACGAMGAIPEHPLIGQVLSDILADENLTAKMAWETVGPGRLTKTVQLHQYPNLTVYPSHYFIPRHFSGIQYAGTGPVFATQEWGSTLNRYAQFSASDGVERRTEYVYEMTQEASVALAEEQLERARQLATEVLRKSPDNPRACAILANARKEREERPEQSILSRSIGGSFFLQRLKIASVEEGRLSAFLPLVTQKKVLHVGCVDSPIFDRKSNLHLALSTVAIELHGLDVDKSGLEELRRYFDSVYFANVDDCIKHGTQYDVVLIPETIEHVSNPESFLKSIDRIGFETVVITAPCIYGWNQYGVLSHREKQTMHGRYGWLLNSGSLVEEVHPDHKFWFSPYTLANLVEAATSWKIEKIQLLENARQVAVIARHREDIGRDKGCVTRGEDAVLSTAVQATVAR